MFAVRADNGFGTIVWRLPQEMYARRSGTWQEVKEIYARRSGAWEKAWNRNYWGTVADNNHPYWRWSLNFNFNNTQDTLSWGTYFSTGNVGFYAYPNSGQLRLSIGARDGGGFGDCYLDPQTPLRVNPGQVYRHTVTVVSRTANTSMSIRAYSNTTKAEAYKGGSGKSSFETTHQVVAAGTTVTLDITIPSGHEWIKPYLYISASDTLPRNYVFSNWGFRRIS
jgi:hypothetical protein